MRRQYMYWFLGGMFLFALVGGGRSAFAQEAAPGASKPLPWNPVEAAGITEPLKKYGLEIHGLVAANYTYNLNKPKSDKNGLLLMNRKHDHFDLDLANIRFQRVVGSGFGFVTDLNFGKTAEVVGRTTRWCENPRCSESRNSFELNQLYLTYKWNGLTVKAGKFVTLHGAEVIKTWDNVNYNISHSILFGYAIPFTHTGLLLNYTLTDWASLDAGFIVGWDNLYDANDGKSFTGGLAVTPTSTLTFYAAGTWGPEQDDRGDSDRGLFSLLTTYKPTDRLTFIIDYNVGHEESIVGPFRPSGKGTKNAYWDGLAGYAIYRLTDTLTASLRGEFFDDPDGVRTGLKQTVWEVTPTLAFQIYPGLTLRAEYRHDESSKRFFERRSTRFVSGQDTFAGEILYSF